MADRVEVVRGARGWYWRRRGPEGRIVRRDSSRGDLLAAGRLACFENPDVDFIYVDGAAFQRETREEAERRRERRKARTDR